MSDLAEEIYLINHDGGRVRVNLKKRIRELMAGEIPNESRADRMALTGIFIAEAWAEAVPWMKEFPGSVPSLHFKRESISEFEPLSESFFKSFLPEEVIDNIRRELLIFFNQKFFEWQQKREAMYAIRLSPEEDLKVDQYDHLHGLIKKRKVANEFAPADLVNHISNGMGTAINVIMNIAKVIPLVFYKERKKIIGGQEFLTILRNSKKMIGLLATMFINDFLDLESWLKKKKKNNLSIDSFSLSGYDFRKFKLVTAVKDGQEKEAVTIDADLMQSLKTQMIRETEVTGCPALAVFGPDGKNVIEEFIDWMMLILEKYYAPALDRAASNQ